MLYKFLYTVILYIFIIMLYLEIKRDGEIDDNKTNKENSKNKKEERGKQYANIWQ